MSGELPVRERDLVMSDLGELLDALGLGNYARPESPHEVMQQCITAAARTGRSHRRSSGLTTTESYNLDSACRLIYEAFGTRPYLVGSAGLGGDGSHRDVDVRLILAAEEFAAACPTLRRWELLCLAIGAYLRERTGLPIDFQVQEQGVANEKHPGARSALGVRVMFAGGGDGTPDWPSDEQ